MKANTPRSVSHQENGAAMDASLGGRGHNSGMSPEQSAKAKARDLSSELAKRSGSSACVAHVERRRLVRVPNVALGKVLDGGRAGAHAAKLVAIKASKGSTYALNEHYCRRKYGVSRRAFQAGLAHAKKCGALEREQHGRSYATEKPLDGGSGGFVLLDEALLTRSSSLVAFILAVNLSPDPMRPADVARRIGVKSAVTIRKLTRQAIDAGAIAKSVDSRGAVLVARKGYKFDRAKNDPIKNVPVKNDPAHSNTNSSSLQKKESSHGKEKTELNGPRLSARPRSMDCFQDDVETVEEEPFQEMDWITLTPWQKSPGISERELSATGPPEAFMSLRQWKACLNAFGRTLGTQIPGHLATPATHQQALEIANEMISRLEDEFSGVEAMSALTYLVAKACAEGRTIGSLGFIAQRILNQLDTGDTSAIHDRPTYCDQDELDAAYELALELIAVLKSHEFPANRASLLSTAALEGLVRLLAKHGRDAFVEGFNHCMEINDIEDEGKVICGWHYFEDDVPRWCGSKA